MQQPISFKEMKDKMRTINRISNDVHFDLNSLEENEVVNEYLLNNLGQMGNLLSELQLSIKIKLGKCQILS